MMQTTGKRDLNEGLQMKGQAVQFNVEHAIERIDNRVCCRGWVMQGIVERPGMIESQADASRIEHKAPAVAAKHLHMGVSANENVSLMASQGCVQVVIGHGRVNVFAVRAW